MVISGLNKDVLERIVKELGLQTLTDKLPLDLLPNIQPVLISNPERIVNIIKTTTTSETMFVVPATGDFFLTGYNLSGSDDGNLSSRSVRLIVTPMDGATIDIAKLHLHAGEGTAGKEAADNMSQSFTPPIKLLPGSNITLAKSCDNAHCSIFGYTVDAL